MSGLEPVRLTNVVATVYISNAPQIKLVGIVLFIKSATDGEKGIPVILCHKTAYLEGITIFEMNSSVGIV